LPKQANRSIQGEFLLSQLKPATGHLYESDIATKVFGVEPPNFSRWMNGKRNPDTVNRDIASRTVHDALHADVPYEEFRENFLDSFDYLIARNNGSAGLNRPIPMLAKAFIDSRPDLFECATAPLSRPDYILKEQAFTDDPRTAAIWLNARNHYSLPLSGREKELALLEEFIRDDAAFKIAALIAPSGAGKTRLVSEWSRPYVDGDKSKDWDAGFVDNPSATLWSEENWQPTKNTLIIIDYTYTYSEAIGAIIQRFKDGPPKKVRLLILDHVLPDKLHDDTVWKQGVPSLGFREARSDLFFRVWPIALNPSVDTSDLLRSVIASAADPFQAPESRCYTKDSAEVVAAANALMQIGAVEGATASKEQIRHRDAIRHPLFAALVGQQLRERPDNDFTNLSRRDLIARYFDGSRRLPWREGAIDPLMGYWVGLYVSVATLMRGLTKTDILTFQDSIPTEAPAPIEGDKLNSLFDVASRLSSTYSRHEIAQ